MRTVARWWTLMVVTVCCVTGLHAHFDRVTDVAEPHAPVRLTRIYTGPDGQTHAEDLDPKLAPSPTPGLQQSASVKATSANFARFAPGFVEDWHPAHARRYVITLTGRGEIELAGGQKVILEPGHVLLTEDLTGKGHIARALTADWTALFVQLDQ